jgi:ketosteroid isomerase-like protein
MKVDSMVDFQDAKQIVARFWVVMQTNDFKAAGELLHDDYILEWPQSGERIRGRENFIAVNENYPAHGSWSFTLHRLIAEGEQVVSDVSVTDGVILGRAITFSTIREGKIIRQLEFWPESFQRPDWRKEWVENIQTDD